MTGTLEACRYVAVAILAASEIGFQPQVRVRRDATVKT
jgi:hypothetical protein